MPSSLIYLTFFELGKAKRTRYGKSAIFMCKNRNYFWDGKEPPEKSVEIIPISHFSLWELFLEAQISFNPSHCLGTLLVPFLVHFDDFIHNLFGLFEALSDTFVGISPEDDPCPFRETAVAVVECETFVRSCHGVLNLDVQQYFICWCWQPPIWRLPWFPQFPILSI